MKIQHIQEEFDQDKIVVFCLATGKLINCFFKTIKAASECFKFLSVHYETSLNFRLPKIFL